MVGCKRAVERIIAMQIIMNEFLLCPCSRTLLDSCAANLASDNWHLPHILHHSPPLPWPHNIGPAVLTGKLDSHNFDCHLQLDRFHL